VIFEKEQLATGIWQLARNGNPKESTAEGGGATQDPVIGESGDRKSKSHQPYANRYPSASTLRQSGMTWDDVAQVYANLGWV